MLVEHNIIRNNCWWEIYANSGISINGGTDFEANTNCRVVIQGNQIYGNEHLLPWTTSQSYSDANGIILDVSPNLQGWTLVQNNVSFNNGGSGIHTVGYNNAKIVHNTAYCNSASPRLLYSEIYASYSSYNIWMVDNVIVAPPNTTGNSAFNESVTSIPGITASTIYFQNNLYFGGQVAIPTASGFSNNLQADPQFITPSIDPTNASFRLRSTSPARSNAVVLAYRSDIDFAGQPRPSGIADQGAYQVQATDCFPPMFLPLPGVIWSVPASAESVDRIEANTQA